MNTAFHRRTLQIHKRNFRKIHWPHHHGGHLKQLLINKTKLLQMKCFHLNRLAIVILHLRKVLKLKVRFWIKKKKKESIHKCSLEWILNLNGWSKVEIFKIWNHSNKFFFAAFSLLITKFFENIQAWAFYHFCNLKYLNVSIDYFVFFFFFVWLPDKS